VSALLATPVAGLPARLRAGDDLAALIVAAHPHAWQDGDVVVIAHKAVSKCEGALVRLADVKPSRRAVELARAHDKDPRQVQVVLDESVELLRADHGVLISRTRHGFVCANAGVDASNAGEDDVLVLLPVDPDGSARTLRAALEEATGVRLAVVVTDSFGRAWRHGQCDVAIGVAGLAPLDDRRGGVDSDGRELRATWIAVADQAAAAADLVRDKTSGTPVVLLRGLRHHVTTDDGPGAAALLRPLDEDLFR
jgi:coenzyme F420-0:L-glutamate ligase / coenzyme F420-1:gamma-L-glutamate ligase